MAFSLLSGTVFVPFTVDASLLSSVFGNSASASGSYSSDKANSQTLSLLAADDVSSVSIFNDTTKNDKNKDEISSDKDISVMSDNALVPETNHLTVPGGATDEESYSDQISVYVVRKGDSISQIADMFGVSTQTIMAANDLKKGEKLKEGDVLFILPVSGIEHTIAKGQTLKGIAKLYKVDVSDIAQFNGISEDAKLAVGDKIMIPDGELVDEGGDKPASNLAGSVLKDKNYYSAHPIQSLLGFFINPVPTGHKTQGLHGPGNRGIDIGAPKGTPIYASASGTILLARMGWNGGYGNMVIMQHPNGTKTLYGHMSKLGTSTGSHVAQGQIIGYVGSTGKSTGPHIHFEVYNAKNPGSDWSWKE